MKWSFNELTSFLASLTVRILLAALNDGVHANKYGYKHTSTQFSFGGTYKILPSTAVKADCTAMRTTPVMVCVVCAIPSSSTKTRIQTTDIARTIWMNMLITFPDRLS